MNNDKQQQSVLSEEKIDELLDQFLEEFCNLCHNDTDDASASGEDEDHNNDNTDDNPDDNEEAADGLDEETAYDDDNLDDDESLSEDDDDDDDDFPFSIPDGEITQNAALSVKVEILPPIKHPREELDKLVGCGDIKARIDELVALSMYNQKMSEFIPEGTHKVSLHSIFFGQPGTGKTTVCKIFGSLLRDAGALSKGHVVVCTRGTFIGALYGDEERAVRQVVEKAQGGVLMIDEAYLLNLNNDKDPGHLVLPMLMDMLADEKQRDIAVVLCGYKEPMMRLLEQNPGLESRFPNRFEFKDFTYDELLEITRRRVAVHGYHFTRVGWERYKQVLAEAYQSHDSGTWGNARFVANLLERIYIRHAVRCVRQDTDDLFKLLSLTTSDIVPIEVPRQKPRIGF